MKLPGKMTDFVLGLLFKKPATLDYPATDKSGMPKGFRGRPCFHKNLCIGCKMCMRDCPSGAITIIKAGEKIFDCELDQSKCIYCGQCVDSCPKKALEITSLFELAAFDTKSLRIDINVDSPVPEKKA
ncbi:MAG: 4Fe-4S binding protein [Candidatus Wallbacteria bacterium]|nr:4Fe-4S binding protein [Candidatus Wallbacteria bacterium]